VSTRPPATNLRFVPPMPFFSPPTQGFGEFFFPFFIPLEGWEERRVLPPIFSSGSCSPTILFFDWFSFPPSLDMRLNALRYASSRSAPPLLLFISFTPPFIPSPLVLYLSRSLLRLGDGTGFHAPRSYLFLQLDVCAVVTVIALFFYIRQIVVGIHLFPSSRPSRRVRCPL